MPVAMSWLCMAANSRGRIPKTASTSSYLSALTKVIASLSVNVVEADSRRLSLQLLQRATVLMDTPGATQDLRNAVNHLLSQNTASEEIRNSISSEGDDVSALIFDDEEINTCDAYISGFQSKFETQNRNVSPYDDDNDGVGKKQARKRSTDSKDSHNNSSQNCSDENENVDNVMGTRHSSIEKDRAINGKNDVTSRRGSRTKDATLQERNSIAT